MIAEFGDCYVTADDMQSLQIGECVTDTIVHFMCQVLTKEFENNIKFAFVKPSITQIIQLSDESTVFYVLRDNDQVMKAEYIFFPLTNLKDEKNGHWSLLLLCKSNNVSKFLHFDSLKNRNLTQAKKLTTKIANILGIKRFKFANMKSPLQNNSFDCGVYTIAIMNEIAYSMKIGEEMVQKITAEFIRNYRIALAQFIISFKIACVTWNSIYYSL